MTPAIVLQLIGDFYGPLLADQLRREKAKIPPGTHVAFRIRSLAPSGHAHWDRVWEAHSIFNRFMEQQAQLLEEQGYPVIWYEYDGIRFNRVE